MLYMTCQAQPYKTMLPEYWGIIKTPRSGSVGAGRFLWCADNDAFNGNFDEETFYGWLEKMVPWRMWCLFVVAPDVVENAEETLRKYDTHMPKIRKLGFQVAFACQDGQEHLSLPREFDALFIGGSTDWKLSKHADECIRRGKDRGAWIHVGRVNSIKRMRHFQLMGVDSVDGTSMAFAPDRHYHRFIKALRQPTLFTLLDI